MPSNPYTQLISYFYSKVGDTFTLPEIRLKWETFEVKHPDLSKLKKKNAPNTLTKTLLLKGFLERKIMEGELEYIPAEYPNKCNQYRKKKPPPNSGNENMPTDGI